MSRRMFRLAQFAATSAVIAAVALLMPASPTAQTQKRESQAFRLTAPKVQLPVHHDTSVALRDMTPRVPQRIQKPTTPPKRLPGRPGVPSAAPEGADSGLQLWHGQASMPAFSQSFDGVNNVSGVLPPDTNGDVGPDHYVQWVNLAMAVYSKTGTLLWGPADGNQLWAGFGGVCETENNGDPVVLYDQLAGRWMISQFNWAGSSGPYYQCIAVSTTGDPLGTWYRYGFLASSNKLNDYPKLGVWPDGYYMAVNQFTDPTWSWGGAGVFAFERAKMLNGLAAQMVYFDLETHLSNWYGGILPSDLDGSTLPPAGAPNYFAEVDDDAWGWASDRIHMFEFHVDWTTPANSTFTGPKVINLTTAGYPFDSGIACGTSGRDCIPQPGTAEKLDAISDRLMHRLAYRNFGTHESLVVNHTVDAGSDRAGVRWYEVRSPGAATPTLHQAGTYAPADGLHRWMGSIAMDAAGNMALGYSVSSASKFPSISYVGRLAGDTAGALPQAEVELHAGGGSQTHSASRWGDYSSMTLDPTDDCTFWYTQEYLQSTGSAPWRTRIGAFKFPSCAAGESGTLNGMVTDDDTGDPIEGATVQIGARSGTTAADGTYSIANVPVGTYDVTASKTGYTSSTVSDITITDGDTTTQDFTLTPAAGPGTLTGTITNSATGLPVAGALVEVDGEERTTGANGVYTFASIESGTYDVTVTKKGFYPKTVEDVEVTAGGTTTQNIAIDPGGTLKGKANRKGAVGIPGATVNAKQGGVTKHTTTTGPTGLYSMPVLAGTYDLEFIAAGYYDLTKAGIVVPAGRTKNVVVTMARPGGLEGTVKNSRTKALLDGVLVELFKGGVLQTSMTTAADGAFQFTGLVPGSGYSLRFTKAGFAVKNMGRSVPDGTSLNVNAMLRPLAP